MGVGEQLSRLPLAAASRIRLRGGSSGGCFPESEHAWAWERRAPRRARWPPLGESTGVRRAAASASARVSGSPPCSGRAREVAAGPGVGGARCKWEVWGGCVGFPGLGCVLPTRAKPGSRQASPVRTGKPRQRWRARGRPEGSCVVQLGPLATSASGRATWCGLRGGASLPLLRLCEGRVAAVVTNSNGQPLRRLGSRVPCLQLAVHMVRSYRRGSLVLSNPIFAGAQEGTAWHIKRKVIKASRFSCVNPTSCNSRQ